jgi:hypothetical protein
MLRVVCLVGGVSLVVCDWVPKHSGYSVLYIFEGDALELEHP